MSAELDELERQARYNRRKMIVGVLLTVPFGVWIAVSYNSNALPSPRMGALGALGYFLFVYYGGNAILRWLAKRWP